MKWRKILSKSDKWPFLADMKNRQWWTKTVSFNLSKKYCKQWFMSVRLLPLFPTPSQSLSLSHILSFLMLMKIIKTRLGLNSPINATHPVRNSYRLHLPKKECLCLSGTLALITMIVNFVGRKLWQIKTNEKEKDI